MVLQLRRSLLAACLGASLVAPSALAAGWDTPILYSAEHMGMGGAAIAYVDDPSAMFHNPAGLAQAEGLSLHVNVSALFGSITASPSGDQKSIESEPIQSVAPLVGVSIKPVEWFAAGVAFYPVASAGATYRYDDGSGNEVENTTKVVFLEIAPNVAFQLPGNLRLGLGWRISLVSLDRKLKPFAISFDTKMSGSNLEGLRAGLQWAPLPELELGVVYRHKTETELTDDKAHIGFGADPGATKATANFLLPSKLGFGSRLNVDPVAVVLDLEYTFQSQNERTVFDLDPEVPGFVPTSVFEWQDTLTLRAGVEYNVDKRFYFRGGFIYDSQATREYYPSAFGTPPGPTTTVTGGFGYREGKDWEMNLAFAHRIGNATVTQEALSERALEDQAAGKDLCNACGVDGDYEISLFGIYLDFTYNFML